ncbi:MAG TPA: hypothetical protein VIK89_13575 [Cytophagaceae bacterium]
MKKLSFIFFLIVLVSLSIPSFSFNSKEEAIEAFNHLISQPDFQSKIKSYKEKNIGLVKSYLKNQKQNKSDETVGFAKYFEELRKEIEQTLNDELEKRIQRDLLILNERIKKNEEFLDKDQIENADFIIDLRATKNLSPFLTTEKLSELNNTLVKYYQDHQIPLYVFINAYYPQFSTDLLKRCESSTVDEEYNKQLDALNKTYIKALAERSKLTNKYGKGALFDIESIITLECHGTPRVVLGSDNPYSQNPGGLMYDNVKWILEHKHYLAFGKEIKNSSVEVLVHEANVNDLRQDDDYRNVSDPLRFGYANIEKRGEVLGRYLDIISKFLLRKYKANPDFYSDESSLYITKLSKLSEKEKADIAGIIKEGFYKSPNKLTGEIQDYAGLSKYLQRFSLPDFSEWKKNRHFLNLKLITTSDNSLYNGKTARQLVEEEAVGPREMILGLHFTTDESGDILIHWNARYAPEVYFLSFIPLNKFWDEVSDLTTGEEIRKYLGIAWNSATYGFYEGLEGLNAMAKGLSNLVSHLKLPASIYDPDDPNYNPTICSFFKYVFPALNPGSLYIRAHLQVIQGINATKYTISRVEFAFYCGFWNAIIDQVQGIPDVVSMLADHEKWGQLVEGFKKMGEAAFWQTVWDEIKKSHTQGNACKIAEQIGSDVGNIATIVVGFLKVGKVAKVGQIMDAMDPMVHILRGAAKVVLNKYVLEAGKTVYRLGKSTVTCGIKSGKLVIQVAKRAGEAFAEIDWSIVKTLELQDATGRKYTVLMAVDPSESINNAVTKIKEIVKDEKGRIFKDTNGDGFAVLDDGTPDGRLTVVKDVEGTGSIDLTDLASLIQTLKTLYGLNDELAKKIANKSFVKRIIDEHPKFSALVADFKNGGRFVDDFKDEWVEAWKAVGKHANIRKHIPSLEKVSDLLNDADFMGKLPNGKADLDGIIDAVKNPLDGGGAHKLVKLSDHLENIKQVVKKHSGAEGFDKLMADLKNPAFAMQDGVTHMLNDVKNFASGKVKKFDYEFDGDGVVCTKCRFDVELSSGTPKLIEYKSWSLENILNISSKQLTEYFRSATSIGDIKYVFNKLKTPLVADVKSQFQVIIGNNAKTFFEANPQLFKTITNPDGTPLIIQNWQQLEGFAKNNPDFYKSSLFDFIEIK